MLAGTPEPLGRFGGQGRDGGDGVADEPSGRLLEIAPEPGRGPVRGEAPDVVELVQGRQDRLRQAGVLQEPGRIGPMAAEGGRVRPAPGLAGLPGTDSGGRQIDAWKYLTSSS